MADLARTEAGALLGPTDPPAFELVNPDGAAAVVFVCDHASRAIPEALDDLGLDETVLARHIAWDIGAAEVARHLAARFDATLVLSGYSRLVVDPNRALDDPTSIPVISDGVVIPGNRELAPEAPGGRAAACFWPYHAAIGEVLERRRGRGTAPALISVHSFTPVFKGIERPWHIGVLWNRDDRIAGPLLDILGAQPELTLGDNQPYSGRDHYGYTVETHAEARGLPHVLVELRQDLVDTHHGAAQWSARLGDALETCFARDPGLLGTAAD